MKYDLQELVHWDENCKVFYVPVEGAKLHGDAVLLPARHNVK
jgi:hypothetical protein